MSGLMMTRTLFFCFNSQLSSFLYEYSYKYFMNKYNMISSQQPRFFEMESSSVFIYRILAFCVICLLSVVYLVYVILYVVIVV